MKGADRFLIAIVGGVVVLVAAVIAVALLRTGEPAYRPGDAPDDVAYNYLLALHRDEYARAHGYLSPALPGYPATTEVFRGQVTENRWSFDRDGDISLAVEAARVTGDSATVTVRRTEFSRGGLFDSGQYSYTFDVTLRRDGGTWQIVDSERYWAICWSEPAGCR